MTGSAYRPVAIMGSVHADKNHPAIGDFLRVHDLGQEENGECGISNLEKVSFSLNKGFLCQIRFSIFAVIDFQDVVERRALGGDKTGVPDHLHRQIDGRRIDMAGRLVNILIDQRAAEIIRAEMQ
jgi:hypothetical protein